MDKDQNTAAIPITTNNVYITINYVFNSISILLSLLLMVIIILLRIKDINYSNRISLNLIMYVSITEIFFSISQMFRFDNNFFSVWNSYLSSWGYIFTTLLICFLIISILINIQLTFTYNHKDIINIKKYYLIISFCLTVILSVLPITFNNFSFDNERNYYWYDSIIWEWATYTGWVTFTILYCLISLIYMLYRLNKSPQPISQIRLYNVSLGISTTLTSTILSEKHAQSNLVSKYISHIIFYSLIPILSYLPSLISTLVYYNTNRYSFSLNLFSLICISSQSIFTFIIFLFDPIIDEVILEHKRNADHKKHVLDNIKKGVYVDNIYNIDRELPSNRVQNDKINENKKRNTIYSYAKNAKNRISILTSTVLHNKKKSIDGKDGKKDVKDIFNLDNEVDDILSLL
ncbi:hypothetical protein RhiirA5_493853 [Rhizophagus irregularis]|uniref:G-protein coupled receptors family 1 profile domain-containing protein n=3 Tax=Rhizophagus irregularis TaxID=588596 RepID=A0A2I1DUH0_9GLOM|nr:hypothetical protein RhiirA5_493853 [Rhizophagus irregularis]GBC28245.2 hypothetical protein GLOIN_2v1541599 [Rhizophagus irregularis DAOM 181602=DAOM 197198]PKC72297.1 hypothetical protein RhiirA1_531322 [Rhizophagus irregularis]PKK79157.1 hypothetical protein RhiirC2_842818 [Rhizophagus irregularis]PKY13515.1 hypothetical protein RhiirB3_518869 [Rhizophagus irregularis]